MERITNAISDNLYNSNVYSVYLPEEEGPGSYHRELGELRKNFFEGGRKKKKYKSKSRELGYPEKIKGSIKKRDLKWKKTAGSVTKEEAFSISKKYVVVIRDLGGSVISKISYSKDMLWIKTEYYRTDNYTVPYAILKPRDTENSIELFTYDFDKKRYYSTILYPVPHLEDPAQQSIINAKHGPEKVILHSDRGSFCYCVKEEQQLRLESVEELKSGTVMLTTAWEVKDGEVPAPAIEKPLPEEDIPDIEEILIAPEASEGVTRATEAENTGEIAREDLTLTVEEVPENSSELTVVPVEEALDIGSRHNYVGNMVRGKREGRGRTEQQNGLTVYDGEYKDNKKDGFGASYYADGDLSYVGGWKEDKKDGVGISFRKEDHALHISDWNDGKADSFTTLIDTDGNLRFSGRIIDGKKQGAGVSYRREDDTIFVGKYVDGDATEYGSIFDKDGTLIYTGGWKDGKREGHGTEFDADGNMVYNGEWKDDKYHNGVLYRKVNP